MSEHPQYTLVETVGVCLALVQRALVEVRALKLIPGPAGERGLQGERGEKGEPGVVGERGAPGTNARQWRHRRYYDAKQAYAEGDVVAHDGGSWLALCDGPGSLPGDGWAQLTTRGQRGKPGDKGERGPVGPEGRSVADVFVNENDEMVVEFSDGTQRSIVFLVTK